MNIVLVIESFIAIGIILGVLFVPAYLAVTYNKLWFLLYILIGALFLTINED